MPCAKFHSDCFVQLGWDQDEISMKFELRWKNSSWNGPVNMYTGQESCLHCTCRWCITKWYLASADTVQKCIWKCCQRNDNHFFSALNVLISDGMPDHGYMDWFTFGQWHADNARHLLFSCDQAAIWLVQSVRPSVCPSVRLSVRHTFFTIFPSSYHQEIFRSYYHGQKWCPCKRSRSEVKGQGHRSTPNLAVSRL